MNNNNNNNNNNKRLNLDTIYNMDCIDGMKSLPDKSIDMILCDLPYGTTQCKWDVIIPFADLSSSNEKHRPLGR